MEIKIEKGWKKELNQEFYDPYFINLIDYLKLEYSSHQIYPPLNLVFDAFNKCPFNETKIVILGQDPYHEVDQAHGLCFSVPDGVAIPPSLRNIFKELNNDLGLSMPKSGNLVRWAEQGVLLLNATLTVRAKEAGSHQNKGWETFTDKVIETLSQQQNNLVFVLWGTYAQKKQVLIDAKKHLILTSVHPSPLSAHRGFFNNHHFSTINDYLVAHQKSAIEW